MKSIPFLKNIKTFFAFKCSNKFILYLLRFLGFTTVFNSMCTVDYGVPMADYVVNGTIKSQKTNQGIQHIQAVMGVENNKWGLDTAFSDQQGKFITTFRNIKGKYTVIVKFKDIDSTNNDYFSDKDTTITFEGKNFTGHHNRDFLGKEEQNIVIYLVPKNE
jgi:putative lipoprotein (rSAM/lipoprotein system)